MTSAGMSHVDGLSVIFITYIPNVHRLLREQHLKRRHLDENPPVSSTTAPWALAYRFAEEAQAGAEAAAAGGESIDVSAAFSAATAATAAVAAVAAASAAERPLRRLHGSAANHNLFRPLMVACAAGCSACKAARLVGGDHVAAMWCVKVDNQK